MSATIAERPYIYSFSENEIRYVFDVAQPDEPGTAVEVELNTRTIGGTYTVLTSFFVYPDAFGIAHAHVNEILKSVIKPQLPDKAGPVFQPVTGQVKQYFIRYRKVTDATPDPAWVSDVANEKMVLLGGVEQMKFRRNNFFTSYMPLQRPFLTWKPNDSFAFFDQDIYLGFLVTAPLTDISLNVTVYYTDASNIDTSFDYTVSGGQVLFHIKAGVQALGLQNLSPSKKIHYCEFSISDANLGYADHYRYYIDYRPIYSKRDFIYLNSLGAWDTIRIQGDIIRETETETVEREHIRFNDSFTTKKPTPQYSQASQIRKDTYSGDVGYLNTPLQQEALTELMVSKAVFEWLDGRWIQVLSLRKKQRSASLDKKWNFPVEWRYGYDDAVFTPRGVVLGEGTSS